MFVKSIMIPKHHCHVVSYQDSLLSALTKLEEEQIDGLPVLDGQTYVGTVTRYSIYENYFKSQLTKDEYLTNTTVSQIATHQDRFLEGNEIFENLLLDLKDYPLLSVVDENRKFLGVVTRSDVLEQFGSAFGVHRSGIRIAFTSVETEGRIAKLAEIAHQFHEQIISLVTFDETDKLVRRIVLKIEKNNNVDKFVKKLEDFGFRILNIHED
ncbi:CBS domain-containing protein [Robertmurraya korlensis]|uniref:CBS domain-containing protein n=1 Tax=Robertmurraya korlensis TaxID=519977 RepID=UPI00203A635B|nr:CBS domain-containing protein [Robertmurraya korlensis]MCM3599747.1 CBS domain-containing protein [Robertmurraya korlensis]